MIPRLLRPTVTWTNLSNNHGRSGGRESRSRAPPLGGAPASATTSRVTGRGTVTGRAWPKPASPHTGTVAQAEASDDCLGKPQWKAAAAEGVDTFITGEGPHWTYALAEELGVNVLYGGHYATETFGVKALAAELAQKFRLPWEFLDHPTGL